MITYYSYKGKNITAAGADSDLYNTFLFGASAIAAWNVFSSFSLGASYTYNYRFMSVKSGDNDRKAISYNENSINLIASFEL